MISVLGHCELPRLSKLKYADGRVRLNVVLLVQPTFKAEFQFVLSRILSQELRELARILPLPVVTVWILTDARIARGVVSAGR